MSFNSKEIEVIFLTEFPSCLKKKLYIVSEIKHEQWWNSVSPPMLPLGI